MKADNGLRCDIEGDELVVRVGINVLAFAAENIQVLFDKEMKIRVCDKREFAKDVAASMCDEDEIGANLLTKLFDKACIAAWENGSVGCH